jgi:hypothetical protein
MDEMGNYGIDKIIIVVRDSEKPNAIAGPDITIDQNKSADLDGTKSTDNIEISNWTWIIKGEDGTITRRIYGAMASIFLFDAGLFFVELNVSDAAGNWNSDFMNIIVRDTTPPIAEAGTDIIINQHEKVILNGSKSYDNSGIIEWIWYIRTSSNEFTVNGENVIHTLDDAGIYDVILKVTDAAGNRDEDSALVTVNDITIPFADAGLDQMVDIDQMVYFNGSKSEDNVGIVNMTWLFRYGNENISLYGSICSFEFRIAGTYHVKLIAKDAAGNEAEDRTTIIVEDRNAVKESSNIFISVFIIIIIISVVLILVRKRILKSY